MPPKVRTRKTAVNMPVEVVNDGIETVITTAAKSLDDMVQEIAAEINKKVVSWIGNRHDHALEIYRGTDRDQYLLTKDGKTVDKLILAYNTGKITELKV
jgi:hypothetical protein